jgi:hypothetical protein
VRFLLGLSTMPFAILKKYIQALHNDIRKEPTGKGRV